MAHRSDDNSMTSPPGRASKTAAAGETSGARARRFLPSTGWTVSILLHLAIALAFLVISPAPSATTSAQPPPNSFIESPPELLVVEPIITDLQVEPLTTREITPQETELELPDLDPGFAQPPAAAISIIGVSDDLGFALPAGGRARPYQTRFAGTGGVGRRICYVVDASVSMITAFDYVRSQLRRAIDMLTPAQFFQIIYFAGDAPRQMTPGQLIRVTTENRHKALAFVSDTQLARVGNARAPWQAVAAALQVAFDAQTPSGDGPDIIYLLSDGQFDQSRLGRFVKDLQDARRQKIPINVIACGSPDNESSLRQLARANQGQYRFVTAEELDAAIRNESN